MSDPANASLYALYVRISDLIQRSLLQKVFKDVLWSLNHGVLPLIAHISHGYIWSSMTPSLPAPLPGVPHSLLHSHVWVLILLSLVSVTRQFMHIECLCSLRTFPALPPGLHPSESPPSISSPRVPACSHQPKHTSFSTGSICAHPRAPVGSLPLSRSSR